MATRVEWRGAQVLDRVLRAAKDGIDETMAECVTKAKRTPSEGGTMPVDTSTLQGSIRLEPTRIQRNEAVGYWGSFDVDYAIYQEAGTRFIPAKNFLRGAAAEEYPRLAGRIQRRLR